MKNDLIERYIYAVTRRMPRKTREDVSMELRGLVDDMLTERCGDSQPAEKDIRIVLTELGSPKELYEKYDESSKKCLIGQPYYSMYLFVLKIVLICSAFGLTVSALIMQMLEPQIWYAAVGNWISMLWNGVVGAFAITTLLYAFFYHKGIQLDEPFNFDNLPPVPDRSQEISKWESITGIGLCVLFAVVFLFTPEVICVIHDGIVISLFDMEVIRNTWFIIVAFAACGIISEVVQLMEGRYNKKVMITALVTNAISAVLSFWWLIGFNVINPTFLANMHSIFEGESNIVYQMFSRFDIFFLSIMLFALVLDTIDVTVKTLRK